MSRWHLRFVAHVARGRACTTAQLEKLKIETEAHMRALGVDRLELTIEGAL